MHNENLNYTREHIQIYVHDKTSTIEFTEREILLRILQINAYKIIIKPCYKSC